MPLAIKVLGHQDAIGPLKELQLLEHSFLRRACRVGGRVPADIIFAELQRWQDFWWRRVLQFWTALASTPGGSIRSRNSAVLLVILPQMY